MQFLSKDLAKGHDLLQRKSRLHNVLRYRGHLGDLTNERPDLSDSFAVCWKALIFQACIYCRVGHVMIAMNILSIRIIFL